MRATTWDPRKLNPPVTATSGACACIADFIKFVVAAALEESACSVAARGGSDGLGWESGGEGVVNVIDAVLCRWGRGRGERMGVERRMICEGSSGKTES